jgi:OmpA-OmpF porin, OOP family
MRRTLLVSVLLSIARAAGAQPAGDLQLDPFRPAIDSRGYLTLNAASTLEHLDVSFGLGSLSWGRKLLAFSNGEATYSVDDVVTATLVGAVGLRLGPARLELGASLPLTVMSGDRGPDVGQQSFKLDGQGLGNLGLHLKTQLRSASRPPHLGLGLIASVYLPTTSQERRFIGEPRLTPQLLGLIDQELGRRLRIGVNGGIRLRSEASFTDRGELGMPGTNRTITASAEVPLGVGFAYALSPRRFDVIGEVVGAIPLGAHERYQPLEALGGIKVYLARNSFLSLGGGRGLVANKGGSPAARAFIGIVFEPNLGDRDGDGIEDRADSCPDQAEDADGFEDADGCPDPDNDGDQIDDDDDRCPSTPEDPDGVDDEDGCPEGDAHDRDGDKILDDADRCPDEPEDHDGWQDEDGCPDPDNDDDRILDIDDLCPDAPEDLDGWEDEDGCPDVDNDHDKILDGADRCPNKPETYNNVDDQDGCPDAGPVLDQGSTLVILEPINFEFNRAVIKPDSYKILDAVVAALRGNDDIQLVEVAGHTDERGDDAYNLDLSIRRAAAVKDYLIDHGIAAARLESQGYGETQPVDKRHDERAWRVNRRVDFMILKRAL